MRLLKKNHWIFFFLFVVIKFEKFAQYAERFPALPACLLYGNIILPSDFQTYVVIYIDIELVKKKKKNERNIKKKKKKKEEKLVWKGSRVIAQKSS